jgi:hypothetical protein
MWDETHDEKRSQGRTALILDTNGNGIRDVYVEPDQPVDPKKDKRPKSQSQSGQTVCEEGPPVDL